MARSAIQPVVDLGRPSDNSLTPGLGLFRCAGRIGSIGGRRHRLARGLKIHHPQPRLQRLLPGEGLALVRLEPQPLHLMAVPVGLVARLVEGVRPGLAGQRRDLRRDRLGATERGDGHRDESKPDHGLKMGAKPVRTKRDRGERFLRATCNPGPTRPLFGNIPHHEVRHD